MEGRGLNKKQGRPASLYTLVALWLVQGLSAAVGGYGLVADPSDMTLGIPVSWLQGSSFGDFLVPGLILLIVLGVFALIAVYGRWARRRWARLAALAVSGMLIVWRNRNTGLFNLRYLGTFERDVTSVTDFSITGDYTYAGTGDVP